jgi:hypothetical protein
MWDQSRPARTRAIWAMAEFIRAALVDEATDDSP